MAILKEYCRSTKIIKNESKVKKLLHEYFEPIIVCSVLHPYVLNNAMSFTFLQTADLTFHVLLVCLRSFFFEASLTELVMIGFKELQNVANFAISRL